MHCIDNRRRHVAVLNRKVSNEQQPAIKILVTPNYGHTSWQLIAWLLRVTSYSLVNYACDRIFHALKLLSVKEARKYKTQQSLFLFLIYISQYKTEHDPGDSAHIAISILLIYNQPIPWTI